MAVGGTGSLESPGSSGSSSSGEVACEPGGLDLIPDAAPVQLQVRNDTDATVWLLWWSCAPFPVVIADASGDALPLASSCSASGNCAEAIAGACEVWCEDHCDGVLIGLPPGELHTSEWDGRTGRREPVPEACSSCLDECWLPTLPAAGRYVATAEVYDTCTQGRGEPCECVDDCEIRGGFEVGEPRVLTVDVDLPGPTTVLLTVDP